MNDAPQQSLPKTFDPASIEARWYAHWEENGKFRPHRPDAEPFTIVNPPPNVTGSLHIGHALDNTLQDILVRYERLRGKDALWVVGMDHAGIATQMVVERQMAERQDKRTNYSREDFVDKVWEWKNKSGGTITKQLRRLGCSMDWSREQFTMDEHFSNAVIKVFVDLYNKKFIYRDKRLVNWDVKLKTAISDLEVETQDMKGHFWHFKYPLADGVTTSDGKDYIEVATTRPETMLADMAVAVHPTDQRYASVVGKDILQPITGRRFKIVTDEHADPELGSGAVKITPGHDFNDFEVGKRAGIAAADMLNMLDAEGNVCQTADGLVPEEFVGLHRFRVDGKDGARELVIEKLKSPEIDCLIPYTVTKEVKDGEDEVVHLDAEPRTIATPFGDRGGVVIEPWLTDQWYVDAETLAKPAIEAVKSGEVEIVPKSWEKTFFHWMENIQPWCVSRQLWWGHRIPAWYGPAKSAHGLEVTHNQDKGGPSPVFVAETFEEAATLASEFYGVDGSTIWEAESSWEAAGVGPPDDAAQKYLVGEGLIDQSRIPLWRDDDVLDTWFSSALWPFATLGWPDAADGGTHTRSPEPVEGRPSLSAAAQDDSRASTSSALRGGDEPNLYARHYPNDVLISGFDILFFWDARMLMQGIELTGAPPWKTLYLHGLVRAADGSKMSKSKGNTVDPLGLIDEYGADALRFFMAAMESQGRDIKMDEGRLAGYRNFATKLWNAARFCEFNGIGASTQIAAPDATLAVNKWIIGEVAETSKKIQTALAAYRFDDAANAIYHFTWDRFCDWYLELIKPVLSGDNRSGEPVEPRPSTGSGLREIEETKAVAGWALDQILVMLHPFMPFITEELWHAMGDRGDYDIITAQWVAPDAAIDTSVKAEIDWVIELVSQIRSAKTELGIPPGTQLTAYMPDSFRDRANANKSALARVGRLGAMQFGKAPDGPAMQLVVQGETVVVPLEGVIDLDAERDRLSKALAAAEKDRDGLAGRLNNANFVERAKPEAVEKARADHAERAAEAERLAEAIRKLG